MNAFTRYAQLSLLALCRERERRAWWTGAVLLLLFVALALGCLLCPAPPGFRPAGEAPGLVVLPLAGEGEREEEPAPQPLPLPERPGAEWQPQLALCVEALPAEAEWVLDWQPEAALEPAPLLACELPEQLSAPQPRAAPSPGVAEKRAAPAAAPEAEWVAARYRSTPRPPYPPSLLQRRVQGVVGLKVSIDAVGVPQEVVLSASSGYAEFDRCAREWVLHHWRFHPARRGGVAVASVVHTQLAFELR